MSPLTHSDERPPGPGLRRLRAWLRLLYHGHSRPAVRFRLGVIVLDVLLIGFFIITPFIRERPVYLVIDYLIAAVMGLDLVARALASSSLQRLLRSPGIWADAVVLATLLFPLWLYNFAFLRVLRLWSLIHSEFFWETIARRYDDTRTEDVSKTLATLVTYLFIVTGFVYALYARRHAGIDDYVDALYFTVTAVTTTGFGDIVLPGAVGKLLTIVIMLSGIGLFVRLAQALFRPYKVRFPCPSCGLLRHDPDAVHCKACGVVLNIPNEGD